MEKLIPRSRLRISSHRNRHNGSLKGGHRIPKGIVNIHASFKNTIVTVTDMWARGFCGPPSVLVDSGGQEKRHPLPRKPH